MPASSLKVVRRLAYAAVMALMARVIVVAILAKQPRLISYTGLSLPAHVWPIRAKRPCPP